MQETDMKEKLQKIIEAYDELQAKMGDPAVLADQMPFIRLQLLCRTMPVRPYFKDFRF